QARPERTSWCARQIRQAMISRLNAAMTSGFPVLQVLVPMAPLLGLIGTVTGMLEVFDAMALRGNADARSMASGVSEAMICTMTGLAVSITGLYPVYYFRTRAIRETELMADRLSVKKMRLRRHSSNAEESSNGIDLAPMLDFVIKLLIFFIITDVVVKEAGLQVNRPTGAEQLQDSESKSITVQILDNGEIWIDNREVDVRAV